MKEIVATGTYTNTGRIWVRCVLVIMCLFILIPVSVSCRDEETLQFYNWGSYIDEDILKDFTKETGIKVKLSTFASNEEMYAKLNSGSAFYDLAIPSDYMIERMIKEGMLEKIDLSNIPNYKNIDAQFKNLAYDSANEYSVPYMWGTCGLLYNTGKVDDVVDSWDILWNAKYAKQIIMYESMRDSFIPAFRRLGYSVNTRDLKELEAARDLLIEQRPLVHAYMGDIIRDAMISGEAAIALMYSGDAIDCMDNNPALAYAVPKEGSNVWFDSLVIPKGARNKDKAEAFIDYLCRPDVALKNTEYIGYSTVNAETFKMLPSDMLENPAYWPDEDILGRCEVFLDLGDFARDLDKAWTEVLGS